MKRYIKITSFIVIILFVLQMILPIITNIEINISYAATLEYVSSFEGNAYSASVKESENDRYWSVDKGYKDTLKQNYGATSSSYVPLFENIYLTKGSVVEFEVYGHSCGHSPCTADVYISNASSSKITYNSSNQTNKVGTLNVPKGQGSMSVKMHYKIATTGYYTADGMGKAYHCSMSTGHGIQIKSTYKIYRYKYNISYNLNGGSLSYTNPSSYYETSSSFTLNNPTRAGYTFTGWTGTGLSSATKTVRIPNGSEGDRSYTATWTPTIYTITLDNQSATNAGTTAYYEKYTFNNYSSSDCNTTISKITVPVKNGCTFDGYYTQANGEGIQYVKADGSIISSSTTFTRNTTLIANWKKNNYNLRVEPNEGMWKESEEGEESKESKNFTLAYDTRKEIPAPTRKGYTFTGWTLEGEETGNTMSSLTEDMATFKMGYGDATLRANWRIGEYELEVKPNGGIWEGNKENKKFTINYKGTKIIPVPSRNGYNFKKWTLVGEGSEMDSLTANNATFTMGSRKATLDANWELITHDIAGRISWNDQANKYTSRPSKVEVILNSDEEVTEENALKTPATKVVTSESYEFKDLQTKKTKDNTNYIYTVKQNKILGYETIVNGYNMTNNLVVPNYTSEVTITPQYNLESEFIKNEQVQIVGIVRASNSNRGKVGTCKEKVNFAIDAGIEIDRDSIKIIYIDKEGNIKEVNKFEIEDNIIKVGFESNRENDNTAGDSLKIEVKGMLKEIKQYNNTISYTGYLRDYETGENTNIHLGTLTTASKEITVGKVSIGIKEINEENEITSGSEFEIRKKGTEEIVQRFTTEGIEKIIRKLEPMTEYVVIETKPIPGYTTAEETTFMLNKQGEIVIKGGAEKEGNTIIIRDHKTRLQIEVREEQTKEYVVGPRWQIIKKIEENGQMVEKIVEEWTSEGKEKKMEKLPIGEYIIREVGIGENTGYVTIEDIIFHIEDTKELQKLEVEQKVSKVQIHIKDEDSKEYTRGSIWQLIDKEEQNIVREWLADGEVYSLEKLPVGEYIIKEVSIGENTGYVTNEEQEISIVDTREAQGFEVEQKISKVQIHIKDEDSKEYSIGSTWQLINKEKQNVVREWLAEGEVYVLEKLPIGDYILKEVGIGEDTGYVTNEEQEISIVDTRKVQDFAVEQKISKVQIHIKDEDSKEYSKGSIWQLINKEKQNIVREWLTNEEVYVSEKVPVGKYILKEVSIGENTGYVTNGEQEINIVDTREMQFFEVEQKISKVRIHLRDIETKEYVEGAVLQIIQKSEKNGKVEEKVIREWITKQEGTLEQRLPVGEYVIREIKLPENSGYTTIEERQIKIIDTLEEQQIELRQGITKIKIEIIDEETKEKIQNVEIEIIEKETGKIIKLEEKEEGYVAERIPIGDYILREKTPDGYKEVKNIEMKVEDIDNVQVTRIENERLIYDMQVEKELVSITIDGEKKIVPKGELQKIEVKESKIKTADIRLEYVIRVSNVGETKATIGKIIDNIPEGFKLVSTDWKQEGNKAIYNAEKEELQPSESKEVRIVLKWENKETNFGEKKNTAELKGSTNPYGYEDKTTNNNIGEEITIFSIKTGFENNTIMIQIVTITLVASGLIYFIGIIEIIIIKRKRQF